MPPADPRLLLLQARHEGDPVRVEEVESFARKMALDPSRITPYNLIEGPPSLEQVLSFDALMVGGSGEYYVSKGNLPGFDALLDLLREIAERGYPTFASCFGFQCFVVALGGEIEHRPDQTELGSYRLELTERGSEDPLFAVLPSSFHAQMGHQDRAARMPPGIPNLAQSEGCELQAFRLPEQPVWATQFHPELDPAENRARFVRYARMYSDRVPEEVLAESSSRFDGPNETGVLLPRFLDLVFDRVSTNSTEANR